MSSRGPSSGISNALHATTSQPAAPSGCPCAISAAMHAKTSQAAVPSSQGAHVCMVCFLAFPNAKGSVRGAACSPALAAAAAVALPLPPAAYRHRSARGMGDHTVPMEQQTACGGQQLPLWHQRRHASNAHTGSSAQHHKVYKACSLALPNAQGSVRRDGSCSLDAARAAAVALALPPAG